MLSGSPIVNQIAFGPCKGDIFALPPQRTNFNRWLFLFKEYLKRNNVRVSVYLVGTFVETPDNATDIDIILSDKNYNSNDHEYNSKIKDAMIYGANEALKLNTFIDMAFYIPFRKDGTFWYSSKEYKATRKTIVCSVLKVFDKFYVNGNKVQDFNNEDYTICKKIDNNLFEIHRMAPGKKHIDRISNGVMYSEPVLLFDQSFIK